MTFVQYLLISLFFFLILILFWFLFHFFLSKIENEVRFFSACQKTYKKSKKGGQWLVILFM